MKRVSIISFLIISLSLNGFAQSLVSRFEAEIGAVANLSGITKGVALDNAFAFHVEIKYNFDKKTPFDLGVRYASGFWDKGMITETQSRELSFRDILLVGNYYFSDNSKISPFVGVGLGFSSQHTDNIHDYTSIGGGIEYDTKKFFSPCFVPQIGVELFRIVRITVRYRLTRTYYSCFELSVGFAFGGWKRAS